MGTNGVNVGSGLRINLKIANRTRSRSTFTTFNLGACGARALIRYPKLAQKSRFSDLGRSACVRLLGAQAAQRQRLRGGTPF